VGAFPALSKLRDEGVIRAWGLGVNTPEPMLRVMRESDPDVCLLASQYSLIDHANALENLFPVARERGVRFMIGSALNAGFVSGSPRYNYGARSWDIAPEATEKRARFRALADRLGTDLRAAALQFSAAPDVVCALVVGARNEEQVLANASSIKATVPPAFWSEAKERGLIEKDAPVPAPPKD
jgi:D-threo-aldose 1-dehydrogenase